MKLDDSLLAVVTDEIRRHRLPDDFLDTVERWYMPVAARIADIRKQRGGTVMISFNGSQGSGKSTLTAFVRLILIHQFRLETVELSIDDFYLTQRQRQQLALRVHPLLATRGVPGTHDVDLADDTIRCLQHCSSESPCTLPRFNKAVDDRHSESKWPVIDRPVDVILFEGWCNHAPVEDENELLNPINELEKNEDPDANWRRYANAQLALYHRRLFDQADLLVLLQAPSFEKVYEWRGLQEEKLACSNTADKHAVMNEDQLRRFIQHYERITRSCLQHLPQQADIVLKLDSEHRIQTLSMAQQGIHDV